MRYAVSSVRRHWIVIVMVVVSVGGEVRSEEPDSFEARDPYPLLKCVVLDAPMYEEAETFDVGDREIRVCCEECMQTFMAGTDSWIDVVDERIIEQETPYYPLTTCIVDGKSLDDFGAVDFVFRNRLFRLCSEDCRKAIEQQPAKYFGLLNKSVIKKQKPKYPLAKCIVSGQPLGKAAIDHVVGNQLIRLAGPKQLEKFDETPGKYLSELRKLIEERSETE